MQRVEMSPSVPKLAFALIACLIPLATACMLRPYSLSPLEREAYDGATALDPYYVAKAAARTELADRRVAVNLLRDLANRYRIAGRDKILDPLDAMLEREGVGGNVVSAQLQMPARPASSRAAADRKTGADLHTALRQVFDAQTSFGALVHQCIEIESANADKPTYNPKLFDWLCRASILPEAVDGMDNDPLVETEHRIRHAAAIGRLIRFAEHCKDSLDPSCGDADKLIAQLINQQPVVPLPQRLNKITVERAPAPASAATATAGPPAIQTN